VVVKIKGAVRTVVVVTDEDDNDGGGENVG